MPAVLEGAELATAATEPGGGALAELAGVGADDAEGGGMGSSAGGADAVAVAVAVVTAVPPSCRPFISL